MATSLDSIPAMLLADIEVAQRAERAVWHDSDPAEPSEQLLSRYRAAVRALNALGDLYDALAARVDEPLTSILTHASKHLEAESEDLLDIIGEDDEDDEEDCDAR